MGRNDFCINIFLHLDIHQICLYFCSLLLHVSFEKSRENAVEHGYLSSFKNNFIPLCSSSWSGVERAKECRQRRMNN